MKKKEKQLIEFIESLEFKVTERKDYIELETWTSGGVNMIYEFGKDEFMERCMTIYENFDIDEEIDLHRQGEAYRNAFTIRASVNDFTKFEETLKMIENKAIELN